MYVPGMPYRSTADAHSGGSAKFGQGVETCLLTRIKKVVQHVLGGTEVNQLVDIVLNTGLSEDGIGHDAAGNTKQGKTVGTCGVVKMIGRLPTAASRHILKNDGRISGNMFGEDRCQGFST